MGESIRFPESRVPVRCDVIISRRQQSRCSPLRHATSVYPFPAIFDMGTTISPFRYLQLARYILQKWLDTPPTISAIRKGKARALPHPRHISAQSGILRASIEERRVLAGVEPSPRIPVAGPSARREPLRPDPRLPPEPSEIYRLMNDERLLVTGAAKPPREIVVLCHGESC